MPRAPAAWALLPVALSVLGWPAPILAQDRPAQAQIERAVHDRHAAGAELGVDLVAIGEQLDGHTATSNTSIGSSRPDSRCAPIAR